MQKSLTILANSPGEMSGWVAPVVTELRQILPELERRRNGVAVVVAQRRVA